MNRTKIQWADYTANPIAFKDAEGKRVWACEKVSAGCANCYASSLNARYHGSEFTAKWMASITPHLFEADLMTMLKFRPKPPFKAGARPTVFVGDMTDIFGEWVPDEWLDRLFAVFALRPDVDWQVLTKRPERMRLYLTDDVEMRAPFVPEVLLRPRSQRVWLTAQGIANSLRAVVEYPWSANWKWPLPNVWLGTSVEDQKAADERIPRLLATPAAVRFLSCEPLLGPVDIFGVSPDMEYGVGFVTRGVQTKPHDVNGPAEYDVEAEPGIDWVIGGGESGTGARPCDSAWLRSLRDQCEAAGVAYFNKQLGSKPFSGYVAIPRKSGDPKRYIKLRDGHGGDPSEWPEDLRRRQFPGEVGHGQEQAEVRGWPAEAAGSGDSQDAVAAPAAAAAGADAIGSGVGPGADGAPGSLGECICTDTDDPNDHRKDCPGWWLR